MEWMVPTFFSVDAIVDQQANRFKMGVAGRIPINHREIG